jgi:phage terminase large subunit GpA-like protein
MNLVLVDGDKYKNMVAARMRKKNGNGSWMVYQGCDQEYAEQVTAEHKVNVKSGSRVTQHWVPKHSHADNHYLDAEVYALAAADIMGVRSMHLLEEEQVQEKQPRQQEPKSPEEEWIQANDNWL